MEPDPIAAFREIARTSPYAWGGLVAILASVYLLARAVTWLGIWVALQPWRRFRGDAWTEKARLAWSGRRLGRVSVFIVVISLLIAAGRDGSRVDLITPALTNLLVVVAALAGLTQARLAWGRRSNPSWALTPRAAQGACFLSLSLVAPLILVEFVLFRLMPDRWNSRAIAVIAGGTLAVGAYIGWGSSFLKRRLGIIRPAADRLRTIVARVAERFDYRPRAIEQVALPMANAFAFVLTGRIGVTDAALAILDDDELAAVCVHELTHLAEPLRVRAMRLSFGFLLGFVLTIPWAVRPMIREGLEPDIAWPVLVFGPLLAVIASTLYLKSYNRLVRRMEVLADARVHQFEAAPGTYARALEKIYEANLVPVVLGGKRQTHPELYDRMVSAGAPPSYPRPAAPPRGPYFLGLLVVIVGMILGSVGLGLIARRIPCDMLDPQSAALWTSGALGGTFYETCTLGKTCHERGDWSRAMELYRAAAELDPSRAFGPAMAAGILAQRRRCMEADAPLQEALRRDRYQWTKGPGTGADAPAIAWARYQIAQACGLRWNESAAIDGSETE